MTILSDAQHNTDQCSHHDHVGERGLKLDGCRAEQQAEAHAQCRRQDPGHEPEPTWADQTLPGADDGTGDEAGQQSGGGLSTRPAIARPATPAIGKARNPAVQIQPGQQEGVQVGVETVMMSPPFWRPTASARRLRNPNGNGEG